MKPHFYQRRGRWFVAYDRPSSQWAFPVTSGWTLREALERLRGYKPDLLRG